MLIQSNIKEVIARLERYQAELPGALAKAWVPEKFIAHLSYHGRKALLGEARTQDEVALVDAFVKTITGELLNGTMLFSMSVPGASGLGSIELAREQFEASRPPRRSGKPLEVSEEENLLLAREAVHQWVQYEKIRDERDMGLTTEKITDNLLHIMGLHPNTKFGQRNNRDEMGNVIGGKTSWYTAEMNEAGAKLAARVQAFWDMTHRGGAQTTGFNEATQRADMVGNKSADDVSRQFITIGTAGGFGVITPERATQWLAAVLAIWRVELLDWLRIAIKRQLATLHHSIWGFGQKELL